MITTLRAVATSVRELKTEIAEIGYSHFPMKFEHQYENVESFIFVAWKLKLCTYK